MLFDLVATLAAGFVGGGIALIVRHLSSGRLPGFFVPGMAGAAMMGFLLWSDYAWYSRTAGTLPDGMDVFATYTSSAAWRPWTLLAPVTERFAVADHNSIRRNEDVPGQLMVEVFLFGRRAPTAKLPVLIDCVGGRRAEIVDGVEFDDAGAVVGARWTDLPADDPLEQSVCPDI